MEERAAAAVAAAGPSDPRRCGLVKGDKGRTTAAAAGASAVLWCLFCAWLFHTCQNHHQLGLKHQPGHPTWFPTSLHPFHSSPPPCAYSLHSTDSERRFMVGLVGYPNVGKSSTINAIFGSKKTAVAPTPGKTKHFQTLNVSASLCLCDCPGARLCMVACWRVAVARLHGRGVEFKASAMLQLRPQPPLVTLCTLSRQSCCACGRQTYSSLFPSPVLPAPLPQAWCCQSLHAASQTWWRQA